MGNRDGVTRVGIATASSQRSSVARHVHRHIPELTCEGGGGEKKKQVCV